MPVSDETTCSNCHATGKIAAIKPGVTWSNSPDKEAQSGNNVLIAHDFYEKTDLINQKPVLCASCHYSPALDGQPSGNQIGHQWMSQVMHDYHADKMATVDGKTIYDSPAPIAGLDPTLNGIPPTDQQACYQYHPGTNTKCLRGAMTDSITCQNCHGDMEAVGGSHALKPSGPIDQIKPPPIKRCQSCHGGDLRGTALSRVAADRSWQTEWGSKSIKKGQPVGCYTCHNGPDGD